MEIDIALLARFENEQMRDLAEFFLNGDTRPIFEDEVDEQYQKTFLSFEDIELPETLSKMNSVDLQISWFSGMEFDQEYLGSVCDSFFKCDCLALMGILFTDGYPLYYFQRSVKSNNLLIRYIDEDTDEYDQILDVAHEDEEAFLSIISSRFEELVKEL